MKPDAYMPYYGNDVESAMKGWPSFVKWAYVAALWHYWHHTHCQGLPDNDTYLQSVCDCLSSEWELVKSVVFGGYFKLEDQKWHQHRCREEYLRAVKSYERKCNGAAKARAKSDIKPDVRADINVQSESESEEREKSPEIPPMSRKDYDAMAQMRGIPKECSEYWWNEWDSKNWLDGNGRPIRKVEPLLLNRFASWRSNPKRNGKSEAGSPAWAKIKILEIKEEKLKGETCEDWQRRDYPEKVAELKAVRHELEKLRQEVLAK